MSNSKNHVSVSGKIYGKAYEYGSAARQLNMNAQPLRRNEESEESREQDVQNRNRSDTTIRLILCIQLLLQQLHQLYFYMLSVS